MSATEKEAVDFELAASSWLDEGFALLALYGIREDGSCACGSAGCESKGKHPRSRHGVHDATRDLDRVRRWAEGYAYLNIGLSAGGFRIFDLDGPVGEQSFAALAELYGHDFPPTKRQTTGNGSHLIYRDEAGSCSSRLAGNLPSLDIRGAGGFIVAAPSKHRSGRRYHVDETPIAPLPSWAKEPPPGFRAPAAPVAPPQLPIISGIGTRYGQAALRDELGRLLPLQPGQGRHSALNVASFRLGQLAVAGQIELLPAYDALLETAAAIGIAEADARRITKSGLGAGAKCTR